MNLNDPIGDYNLSSTEQALLKKGNLHTVADLVLASTQDVAKKCKKSPIELKRIVDKALDSVPLQKLNYLDTLPEDELFTTGDEILDSALGGGIRTCMVWEAVGESAAGKTQFALQLSLYVQAPPTFRGLSGATCYLTTSSTLPTARLLQIAEANGLLSIGCSLEHVHTIATPTVAVLQRVLSDTLPSFIHQQASDGDKRPVKLLVIDALGELFHSNNKTTTSTLVERSKDIAHISASLHELASKYRLAVLILNEVIDVFKRSTYTDEYHGDMPYDQQSRWFNTAEFFGEGSKEAALGLSWANQVNTRIMLSRTGRRKYIDVDDYSKRRHLSASDPAALQTDKQTQAEPILIRRISVLFSSVTTPTSFDYVVTERGISILQDDPPVQTLGSRVNRQQESEAKAPTDSMASILDKKPNTVLVEGDEFDQLWDQEDYQNFDWDALEMSLSQNVTWVMSHSTVPH